VAKRLAKKRKIGINFPARYDLNDVSRLTVWSILVLVTRRRSERVGILDEEYFLQ